MRPRHSILAASIALAALGALFVPLDAGAVDPERGRALYELRCGTCHSESVHGRKKRVATDFSDVQRWVGRWNAHLGLRWEAEEMDDVSVYLNNIYYRFPCPPQVCKRVS